MRPSTRGLSPQPHSGRHASGPARDFTSLAPTSRAFTPALRFERVVLLVLRNLETWEIVDQVLQVRAEAKLPVRGVVFMGMGEPLLNYANATRAARIMCHPAGLAISGKSITFSTAGWVPGIRKYRQDKLPYRLAFSITSAIPEKRVQVLPVEKTWPAPPQLELSV